MRRGERSARALAVFLIVAGIAHFVAPDPYNNIVPGWLPMSAGFWTFWSGVAEIAVGVLVALRRTRAIGAALALALFVAVFPANIKMAIDWADRPAGEFAIALLRLPLQIPLIVWAYRVWKRSRTPEVASIEPAPSR